MQIKIKIRFFASLRDNLGVKEAYILLTDKCAFVDSLLAHLTEKYGLPFHDYLYEEEGLIRSNLQFLLNGKNIETLNGFETELKEGDEFAIIPPMSGG